MAILDRIYALRQRPTYELRINGVLIVPDQPTSLDGRPAVYSMRGGERYDEDSRIASPPYLDIEVSRIPRWMRKGMAVTLDAGYDGEHVRVFTGGIWALGEEDPDYLRTQCIGTGATAADGTRIERTASLIGGPAVWPPIPSGQYIDFGIDNHLSWTNAKMEEIVARELTRRVRIPRRPNDSKEQQTIHCKGDLYGAMRDFKIPERDLSGDTVQASIEGILDDAGVGSHNISVGAFTLAAEGATLDRMPGAGMLTPLLMLQGAGLRQLPSGLVIARVLDEQPAPTAAFSYSTTDQDYARIISADPPVLRVPFNPLAQIWQTIALELDYLGVDGRFWLTGHDWEIGPGAFSYLDLRGGDEFGGTVGINPVASFTYAVALQVIGDELYYTITFTDTSTDPDGTIDQAASTWADNQTTIPEITTFNGDPVATIRIAVADVSGDFEVTRYVEDNDGLSDTYTEILDLSSSSSAVTIPPIGVAAGTRRMVTPDGGQTWNDTTPSSKTATAVGARLADGVNSGHFAYGHSNGSIDVTRDANVTIAAALAAISPASAFMDVQWDWRDHRLVWALTDDCRLYLSNDYGATFFLLANFRTLTYGGFGGTTVGALGNLVGMPGGGGLYIFGGDGAGRPLIAYNTNPFGGGPWIRVTHLGDLLTDLATPADATMRIVSYAAPGYGGENMILAWASGGEATLRAIYHASDAPGPARTFTRATGLTAGLKNGRVIMESGPLSPINKIAMFGDRDVWQSLDGIAFTEISDVLPSGFTPNHGLFVSSVLGGMAGIYEHLIAVEDATGTGGVMKSTDEGATFNYVRPATGFPAWPAGAKAKKLAIGAPVGTVGGAGNIAIVRTGAPGTISFLRGAVWTTVALPAQIDNTRPRVYCLTADNWIVCDTIGFPAETASVSKATRTVDGGATWADAAIGDENTSGTDPLRGFSHIARGADARLWGVREAGNDNLDPIRCHIYYSDDDGATWTLSSILAPASSLRYPFRLIAHPTNPNVVALITSDEGSSNETITHITTDRGASWTTNQDPPTLDDSSALIGKGALILPNGRIILTINEAGFGTPDAFCYTSDNEGATYTLRQTIANSEHFVILAGASANKIVLFRPNVSTIPGTDMFAYSSLDQGMSYAQVGPAFPNNSNSGSNWSAKYDPVTDTLYVLNGDDGSGALRVHRLSPVAADGVWVDISYNLSAGGAAWDALAVIPA